MKILNILSSIYLFFLFVALFTTVIFYFFEKIKHLFIKNLSKNFLFIAVFPVLISFYITLYTYWEQSKCPENNIFDGHTRCTGINGIIHIALNAIPGEAKNTVIILKVLAIILMIISALKICSLLLSTGRFYKSFSKKFLPSSERLGRLSEKINKNLSSSIKFQEALVPVKYTGIIGLLKPVVILPEQLTATLNDRELEGLMYHEACHVINRDNPVRLIILLCNSLLFFLPLKFYREWDKNRDLECDKFSAFYTENPLCIASALVKTVELSTTHSEDYAFSCFGKTSIRLRLEKLIEYSKNRNSFFIEKVSCLLLLKNMSFYLLFFCFIIILKQIFNIEHCVMELLINI
jgi:beta-lactamase regulating signal transducer with metallopeptidase domain